MSNAFPMPNHPRANIQLNHSLDNDHAITVSYDGVGEHTQTHIFLTLHEMPELVRAVTDYVTQQIPMYGLASDDRADFEVTLELLQKYLQREQEFQLASSAHGVIAAVPSQGDVEFRAVDIDLETQDITGGRSYRVAPAIASQWLTNNILCTGHLLPLDGLIAIRDTAAKFIDHKLHGQQQAQKLSALVLNAFAQHYEKTGQQLAAIKARAMEQGDLDKVNRFCSLHRPLRLDPAAMLRTATEIENLRQATINISVKLAHSVASAIGAAQFGATVAEIDGQGYPRYSELNKAELSRSTGRLFDKALVEIESRLKAVLTAATRSRIKLLTRVDNVSNWLTSAVVDHIADQYQEDSHHAIAISEEQAGVIGQMAGAWYWDSLGAVLESNDMLGLMLTGRDAGIATNLSDFTDLGLVYPLRQVTNL